MLAQSRSQAATSIAFFFTILSSFQVWGYAAIRSVETPNRICLNVREDARFSARATDCIRNGQSVRIIDYNPQGYSRVDLGGRTGFVWTKYLKSDTSPAQQITPKPAPRSETTPRVSTSLPTPSATSTRRSSRDISTLTLATARSLETNEIGQRQGFTLRRSVGWAKMDATGDIEVGPNRRSHCTSATHAALLKTLGQLHKEGHLQISDHARRALNSPLFRDVWNSNGYGPAKVIELLGGQSFRDISEAKPGDILKIDRAKGTGHMVIFSGVKDGKVCYWSSNRGTQGLGERCENTRGSRFVFSRFTDMKKLEEGLTNLDSNLRTDLAFADVRRRQGNGFVKLASLDFARTADLRSPVSLRTRTAGLGVLPLDDNEAVQ